MTIGRPAKPRTAAEKLLDARIAAARKNTSWTEIPDDLVPRPHGVLVSASTDAAYTLARGALFEKGSARIVADWTQYFYVVSDDAELVVLERMSETWSDQIARRARRRQVAS